MIGLVVGVLLSAVALQFIAGLIPGFEIEDWGAAFWAALILGVVESGALFLWDQMGTSIALREPWQLYGVVFIVNTVSLGFVALVIDGVRVRNPISLLAAGAALTVVSYAAQLLTAEIGPVILGW